MLRGLMIRMKENFLFFFLNVNTGLHSFLFFFFGGGGSNSLAPALNITRLNNRCGRVWKSRGVPVKGVDVKSKDRVWTGQGLCRSSGVWGYFRKSFKIYVYANTTFDIHVGPYFYVSSKIFYCCGILKSRIAYC